MKTLVTYFSESGNTQKVAQSIYANIEGDRKKILPLAEIDDPAEYDLFFVGFPVQASSVPRPVEKFIKNLPPGKMVALFATHGSLRGGRLAITAFYHALSLAPEATMLGTYGCRGEVNSALIEKLLQSPEHRAWALEAQSAAGHPDEADLEEAREFARQMFAKARSL
jgi:flavodoxin